MNQNKRIRYVFLVSVCICVMSFIVFKNNYAFVVLKSESMPFQAFTKTIHVVRKNTVFELPKKHLFDAEQAVLFKGWSFDNHAISENRIRVYKDMTVYAVCKKVTYDEVVEYLEIPFKTIYIDPNKIDMMHPVSGENGIMEIRTRIIYHDDVIVKTEKPRKFVKESPIDEIKHINLQNSRQQ
ncbi:hypothetical protein [Erysipelothrix sp. P66]|uniref:hypothetical protein n=1 Tax=Erysipelothrix sp. P66 TaxID=3141531 RepID=UPI00315D3BC1